MSGVKQTSSWRGRQGCRKTETGIAVAGTSEISDSDSPKGRSAEVRFSSEHSPIHLMEIKSRSTCRKNKDESYVGYVRAGLAFYVNVHRESAVDSEKRKVKAGLAEPFHRQCAKNVIKSSRENLEPQKSVQSERNNCLHASYYRPVFL